MGKKIKRPSKHQIRKDVKRIKKELKNSKLFLAAVAIATAILFYYWWDNREHNVLRIALILCCMSCSVGFSKLYAIHYKYKQALKVLEDRKMK